MFTVTAEDGAARCGVLALGGGRAVETPAALVYTRRGGAPNLVPALLDGLRPHIAALHLDALHL
jgi:hypothetical protein